MPSRVAAPPESEFGSAEVTYKGGTYHFTELTAGAYDKCEDKARDETKPNGINNVLLTRLMMVASATDPKISLDDIAAMPLLKVNVLARTVNELHLEPVEKPEPGKA